jgi:hypothetical protein
MKDFANGLKVVMIDGWLLMSIFFAAGSKKRAIRERVDLFLLIERKRKRFKRKDC